MKSSIWRTKRGIFANLDISLKSGKIVDSKRFFERVASSLVDPEDEKDVFVVEIDTEGAIDAISINLKLI